MDIVALKAGTKLANIVKAAGSKKRKAIVHRSVSVQLSGTYWDEGSVSEYTLVDLDTMKTRPLPRYNPPQFGGPKEAPSVKLELNQAVVCGGFFCGRPATPTVYFHHAYQL